MEEQKIPGEDEILQNGTDPAVTSEDDPGASTEENAENAEISAESREPAEQTDEKTGKNPKDKKPIFGRSDGKALKNAEKELKTAQKELEETRKTLKENEERIQGMTERIQRSMAEFDNFRKRSEKEKGAMYDVGVRAVIEKLLPVVDNFERGLAGLSEEQKNEPFAAGMDLVYKQILKLFDELEVKPIEAVGQPFDPDKHNAVMHVEDDSVGENTIVQEFQKGYTCRGNVVRYSMVKVAN